MQFDAWGQKADGVKPLIADTVRLGRLAHSTDGLAYPPHAGTTPLTPQRFEEFQRLCAGFEDHAHWAKGYFPMPDPTLDQLECRARETPCAEAVLRQQSRAAERADA